MAKLGFIFEVLDEKIVVMIDKEKPRRDFIVGFSDFLNIDSISRFLYLSPSLSLTEVDIIDKDRIKYARISLSDKTLVSYVDNIFWLSPARYKHLKQVLKIETKDSLEKEIVVRVHEIFDYFR